MCTLYVINTSNVPAASPGCVNAVPAKLSVLFAVNLMSAALNAYTNAISSAVSSSRSAPAIAALTAVVPCLITLSSPPPV